MTEEEARAMANDHLLMHVGDILMCKEGEQTDTHWIFAVHCCPVAGDLGRCGQVLVPLDGSTPFYQDDDPITYIRQMERGQWERIKALRRAWEETGKVYREGKQIETEEELQAFLQQTTNEDYQKLQRVIKEQAVGKGDPNPADKRRYIPNDEFEEAMERSFQENEEILRRLAVND